jgi:hypothetical protein
MKGNKMRIVLIAISIIVLCYPSTSKADGATKRNLIEQYLQLTHAEEAVGKTLSQLKEAQKEQLANLLQQEDVQEHERAQLADFMKKYIEMLESELSWLNMKNEYVSAYDSVYSEEELSAAVQFYSTPLGRKFVNGTLELNEKLVAVSQQRALSLLPKIEVLTAELSANTEQEQARKDKEIREKGVPLAKAGAAEISAVLTNLIDSGRLTMDDLFDDNYIPILKTNPQKYSTRFDKQLDLSIQSFEDKFLKDNVVFAVAVDHNGYIPTHNSVFAKPLTGDIEKDRVGNRTKRKFDDQIGLAAARNQGEPLVQQYQRDNGDKMYDFSAPIIIKDRHWGAFRVGMKLE